MKDERLYNILLACCTTEKSTRIADKYKQIMFKVKKDTNKKEIKYAVEKIFSVVVDAVRVSNVKGKMKRFKQAAGQQASWKKAIVSLKKGYDINLAEFE